MVGTRRRANTFQKKSGVKDWMRALCLTPFTHPSLAILHSGLTDPWPRCVEVKVGCTLDRLPLNHWATQSQQASALTSTANAESPMSLTCVFGDIRADKGRTCKIDILHSDRKSFGSRQIRMEQFCCAGWASRSREPSRTRLLKFISAQLLWPHQEARDDLQCPPAP